MESAHWHSRAGARACGRRLRRGRLASLTVCRGGACRAEEIRFQKAIRLGPAKRIRYPVDNLVLLSASGWTARGTIPFQMLRTHRVLLFDLDGVLITLGGYHRALQATVNLQTRRMGLGDLAPDEAAIDFLETGGLTVEWDSSAICLAVLVTDLWCQDPGLRLPGVWEGIVSAIRTRFGGAHPHPDYFRWGEKICSAVSQGSPAPRTALDLLLGAAQAVDSGARVEELRSALEVLLGLTRDFRRSVTMRVFQHFTLGSEGFRRTYGEEPCFETPSLLEEYDGPTLPPEETQDLVSLTRSGETRAAVFTLRLTRPALPSILGGEYAPEAEVALERLGLSGWPVVGFGQLRWLAGTRNAYSDLYLKPCPAHALAAIARALGAAEEDALRSASRLLEEDQLTGTLTDLREEKLALHVFEDSSSSLRGVEQAVRLLRGQGANVAFHPWGIASTPRRGLGLKGLGYPVFEKVGQALTEAGILASAPA